ncbi:hypothetical protein G4B88_022846 [Cannabis sativa]|uniref:Uncharacterized protein n=1 Tax=Cannabis sativa TaxID=3483 RepID=A0A7J6HWW3_CANSA|nr:hypothetical protein G4B88_022846 [Cannabis sativa]
MKWRKYLNFHFSKKKKATEMAILFTATGFVHGSKINHHALPLPNSFFFLGFSLSSRNFSPANRLLSSPVRFHRRQSLSFSLRATKPGQPPPSPPESDPPPGTPPIKVKTKLYVKHIIAYPLMNEENEMKEEKGMPIKVFNGHFPGLFLSLDVLHHLSPNFKIEFRYFLLSSSGCLYSSGLAHGMKGIDQTKDHDLEDDPTRDENGWNVDRSFSYCFTSWGYHEKSSDYEHCYKAPCTLRKTSFEPTLSYHQYVTYEALKSADVILKEKCQVVTSSATRPRTWQGMFRRQ